MSVTIKNKLPVQGIATGQLGNVLQVVVTGPQCLSVALGVRGCPLCPGRGQCHAQSTIAEGVLLKTALHLTIMLIFSFL